MKMKVNIPLGNTQSVEAEWKNFSQKIFTGQRPSATQFEETRKSFYAGFYSCLATCLNIADGDEEQGAKKLESLRTECEKFFENELQAYMEKRN